MRFAHFFHPPWLGPLLLSIGGESSARGDAAGRQKDLSGQNMDSCPAFVQDRVSQGSIFDLLGPIMGYDALTVAGGHVADLQPDGPGNPFRHVACAGWHGFWSEGADDDASAGASRAYGDNQPPGLVEFTGG